MPFFKHTITESSAAKTYVTAIFKSIEKHWPAIKKRLLQQLGENFVLQAPAMAPVDLALAVIATGLQSLPQFFPADQARRIQAYVITMLESMGEYGSYALEEVELYEQAWKEGAHDFINGNNPLYAIPRRLLARWLYSKEEIEVAGQKVIDPIALMVVAELLMMLSGSWKEMKRDCKIVPDV